MDNLILSDEILNQQICTVCQHYLSVGPVTITREGKIICGICRSTNQIKPTIFTHSLYNLLAENLVFKCVHYYQGCKELLFFNEARKHEKTCKYRQNKLKCPFCCCVCNGCQLVQHFHRKHPEYMVKEGIFKITMEKAFSRNIIFVEKSNVFCLLVSTRDSLIEFFNVLVTPMDLGPKQFRLRFFKSGTNVEFVTASIQITDNFSLTNDLVKAVGANTNSSQIKNSFSLDQTSLLTYFPSGWCVCKIELIDDNNCGTEGKLTKLNYLEKISKKIIPTLQIHFNTDMNMLEANMRDVNNNFNISSVLKMSPSDLRQFVNTELYLLQNCVNCDVYIARSVFFCPKYHMSCQKCVGNKCHKCRTLCQWSSKPQLNISLPCEWKGCCSCPNIFYYMTHKRDCVCRKYSCPDRDCLFQGWENNLRSHWHMNPLLEIGDLILVCKSQSIYWRNNYRELFYICIEYKPVSLDLSMIIEEVDVVMSGRYQFLVRYSVTDNLRAKDMSQTLTYDKKTNNYEKLYVTFIVRECPVIVSCTFK